MKEFKTSMEEKGSFYASRNLFPSFVLEIESQSPAFLFSPPFLTRYTHFRVPISIFTHPTLELNYTPKVGWDEAATRLRGDHKEDSFHSFLSQLYHFVTFFLLFTFFLSFFCPFFLSLNAIIFQRLSMIICRYSYCLSFLW